MTICSFSFLTICCSLCFLPHCWRISIWQCHISWGILKLFCLGASWAWRMRALPTVRLLSLIKDIGSSSLESVLLILSMIKQRLDPLMLIRSFLDHKLLLLAFCCLPNPLFLPLPWRSISVRLGYSVWLLMLKVMLPCSWLRRSHLVGFVVIHWHVLLVLQYIAG